jgi:nitrate reductase gamma subunit
MSDNTLFGLVPLLSSIVFAIAAMFQLARRSLPTAVASPWSEMRHRRWYARVSVVAVVLVHVALIAWPTLLLYWIREPFRLLALEAVSFTAGGVATVALGLAIRRRLRSTTDWPIGDVVFLSALVLTMSSGLGLALVHRWAAAWSISTLTPYVHSLLSLQPDVSRLDEMPYLVRLHVVSTFLVVAALPFSTAFEVVRRAWYRVRLALTPVVETMDRRCGLAQERMLQRSRRLMWPEEND